MNAREFWLDPETGKIAPTIQELTASLTASMGLEVLNRVCLVRRVNNREDEAIQNMRSALKRTLNWFALNNGEKNARRWPKYIIGCDVAVRDYDDAIEAGVR